MNTIEDWIQKLRESRKLIIVEGKKDKEALESFGIKNIVTFSNSSYLSIENINEKEVIILTDLDAHGKKLYSILRNNLQKNGIKIDNKFRKFLFKETNITNIESLKKLNFY